MKSARTNAPLGSLKPGTLKPGWLKPGSWRLGGAVALALCAASMAGACGDSSGSGGGGGEAGSTGNGGDTYAPFEAAPGGVRRLTSTQLRYSMEYLLGSEAAADLKVWNDIQLNGFEALAASEQSIGANDVSALERKINETLDFTLLADTSTLESHVPCIATSTDSSCYEEVAVELGRLAWRRPIEDDEKGRLLAIAEAARDWAGGDFDTGLRYEMSAIFQSPNFIYIPEIGVEDTSSPEAGGRLLTQYELASRLSFFLVHRTPDRELLDAAEAGELGTDEQIREHARRLLRTPEARRSLDRFFGELYLIDSITGITKDAELYPAWGDELAASMQAEMLRFLQDIVWTRDADAREIFLSRKTYVDATIAGLYGVAAPAQGWQELELPAEGGRFGLFGKAGFLARFAHPKVTSPTRRGRFYREKILCREIPPPPNDVDTTLPEPTEPKTMRERLEAHRTDAKCAGCHSLTDPIGLAYEHFDAMGKFRETENGFEIITADKSGTIEFEGPEDLAQYAADNAAACMVQHFWRQSMGHEETEGEEGVMAELEDAFQDNGYSLQDLMVELTVSVGFRRVGDPK